MGTPSIFNEEKLNEPKPISLEYVTILTNTGTQIFLDKVYKRLFST